jgi:hypothetical protein
MTEEFSDIYAIRIIFSYQEWIVFPVEIPWNGKTN